MKLVMDLVVNHTSDEHPWFVESRSSRDNPKRDWYWWRDARAGMAAGRPGAEPTNWGSFFSGNAWALDEATGQYYLHLFSTKQPDLNWENPEVRHAVYSMMNWWLDRGVDGFRMDVINLISKDTDLPDGLVHAGALHGDGWPYFVCGPRIHEFLQEMHREVFEGRDPLPLTVGEMPGVTIEQARLFTDPARREVDMVFQFEHMSLDGRPKFDLHPLRPARPQGDLRSLAGRASPRSAGTASTGTTTTSPEPCRGSATTASTGWRSAKCLATLLHLHRGTPYVYQGEELGMTNAPFDGIEDFRDIESLNHYAEAVAAGERPGARCSRDRCAKSRDHARTPVQWDATDQAGFTTGTPWIAVNPNYPEINAAAERADPGLGVPPLPPAHRAAPQRARRSPTATSRCCCPTTRARLRVHPAPRAASSCSSSATCRQRPSRSTCRTPSGWADAEVLLRTPGNGARRSPAGAAPRTVGGARPPTPGRLRAEPACYFTRRTDLAPKSQELSPRPQTYGAELPDTWRLVYFSQRKLSLPLGMVTPWQPNAVDRPGLGVPLVGAHRHAEDRLDRVRALLPVPTTVSGWNTGSAISLPSKASHSVTIGFDGRLPVLPVRQPRDALSAREPAQAASSRALICAGLPPAEDVSTMEIVDSQPILVFSARTGVLFPEPSSGQSGGVPVPGLVPAARVRERDVDVARPRGRLERLRVADAHEVRPEAVPAARHTHGGSSGPCGDVGAAAEETAEEPRRRRRSSRR